MPKIFEKPWVQARYRITNESIDKELQIQANYQPRETRDKNAIVGDIIPQGGRIIYIILISIIKDLKMIAVMVNKVNILNWKYDICLDFVFG